MFEAQRPGAAGFGGATTSPANPFGQLPSAQTPATNPFASATTVNISSNPFAQSQPTTSLAAVAPNPFSGQAKPSNPFGANGAAQASPQPFAPANSSTPKPSPFALAKDNIRPPQWPANPGSEGQRKAAEAFREAYNAYREKARNCLIKANLIDDPDQRRALSDALQFKGICEDMCPAWERITRIVQHDVKREEREDINGENQANIELMVTRHARSSAGQDAPLPMDVRSPGALKRTLKYMIDELIPEDHFLPARHNFLWDRTRAIRKDFIYQEYAMGHDEMQDYIYCLETIARFHVTALHLLTQPDFAGKDFSAQQENEQLEKTLISLMQAYDDCAKQGIECKNEADFRSYYIIVMADNPAWMDVVQSFAARFWNGSDSIRTASILVESLKNIWDMQGPLMPPGTSEMALPIISMFFDIVSSPAISYTMACFAEIHFPKIRRLMLKLLREAYWRPKTGPTDLTPAVIQRQLRLDSEQEAIDFAQSQGFVFKVANGQTYAVNNARQALSEDKPPRMFSKSIVERKRGNHSLAEVIYTTFYQEASNAEPTSTEADSLFVDGSQDVQPHAHTQATNHFNATPPVSRPQSPFSLPSPAAQDLQPGFQMPPSSSASTPATAAAPSIFSKPPATTDSTNGTAKAHSTSWSANPSAAPSPFSSNQTVASPPILPTAAGNDKTSIFAPTKPTSAPEPAKSSPFTFSSGQQPLPSSSPGIFAPKPTEQASSDKPTSSILSGSSSSGTSGFVFPSSGSVTAPKPSPPISTTSQSAAKKSSFNPYQPSTPALQAAPSASGLVSSTTAPANATTVATEQDAAVLTPQSSTLFAPPKPLLGQSNEATRVHAKPEKDPMELFTRWYVCADRGLMDEHLEQWMLESILRDTFDGFEAAELERIRKEEDEQSWAEARKFREYSLGVTYFYRWLDGYRKRRAVKRIQLEKQKAREWNSPDNRAKRAAATQIIRDKSLRESRQLLAQKKSTYVPRHKFSKPQGASPSIPSQRPRRDSLEEALLASQESSSAHSVPASRATETKAPVPSDEPLPGEKNLLRFENQRRKKRGLLPLRKYPEAKTYKEGSKSAMLKALSSGTGRDTMSLSTNSLRNSTFSSSYRSSLGFNGSRVSKPTSRVSDPYWKLKANGLVQMPNGEYLHESLAIPMLEDGRRFPGIGDYGISGSSRGSLSQSPAGSTIEIHEFSPPPPPAQQQKQQEQSGIDSSLHRRRSRVSMSPAASVTSGLGQYHHYHHHRRISQQQQRPHSVNLQRDRKRGHDDLDDDDDDAAAADGDQDDGGAAARFTTSLGSIGRREGSAGILHKRARSSNAVRGRVASVASRLGAGAGAAGGADTDADADVQSVASLGAGGDSDFLASIDRLLKDVQDAGRTLG
ncbi:SAC3/GANP/Nin1/mts3/eIF-3 p25 family-domain-containing protein [Microdochium bolleyi]|uniref:SAC3/GANP/Nin1/mts3/eIF-3 p25 family-domain-containing protein n=1 Tax=Microdochium bolleyi TaxID=196109 RepID=A0A136J7X0_9PEZI|nr:SAC3/GANP/Nin1/mts3/eIF-3 p25 family-domain-containing protein [Microdochium bolleyi]